MDRPPSRTRGSMSGAGPALSLEASLDEENRAVLAALDRKRPRSPAVKANRTATPPPPVRSMLDVDSPPIRRGSIAGIGVGITSTRKEEPPSALDPSDPSTWTSPHTVKPGSPTTTRTGPAPRARHPSDTGSGGPVGLPKIEPDSDKGFEHVYQFDISSIPSTTGASVKSPADTKRAREGSSGAMAAALTGDFSSLHVGRSTGGSGRHNSTAGIGGHSRSPSSRIRSPAVDSAGLLAPTSQAKTYVTGEGTVVDDQAHRRLSNKSSSFSTVTDESEEGAGRVTKDRVGDEGALEESSEEEVHSSDSEDDKRGRDRDRAKNDTADPPKEAQSQLAAAEQERKTVSHSQFIKSMLEPSISVTSPTGEKTLQQVSGMPPSSNAGHRGPGSAAGSQEDDEDGAIAKAKTLGLNISPLDTKVKDRHVRMIIRGDWVKIHADAVAGQRTTRTYLTCSDLSTEATYALEWTVGTIMRDGDTLLAIYAIEDETAGGGSHNNNHKVTDAEKEILHAEGAQAGKEASDAMESLTRQTTLSGAPLGPQEKYIPATEAESLTGSVDARKVGKREMERLKAIEDITQTFLKLVRKTPLQVRCMVEVIHCKSPKHLILGAIDELEPTLTIVGTRGRSSLKGVLLGSFSNYLVTKSSAPVMVARRRLKKPRSQVRVSSNKIRLSNNLMASALPTKRRSLTQARID